MRSQGGAAAGAGVPQLTAWLRRAQSRERLAECDVETLAATILGALHNWAFAARLRPVNGVRRRESHVEHFIELLWNGIGGSKP